MMEVTKDEAANQGAGGDQPRAPISNGNPNPNPNPNSNTAHTTRGSEGKLCTGCTYYSSLHKAESKNPTCVGLSETLRLPPSPVGEAEVKASKEGHSLTNFKYVCIGRSAYFGNKKLPFCQGLQVVVQEKASNSHAGHVPATHKTEDEPDAPQPRRYILSSNHTTEFLNRFQRNAGLVASGVAKNMSKVGNYVKELLNDILN